jgi:hypothetical protein
MIEQNRRGLLTGMALSTAGLTALAGVATPAYAKKAKSNPAQDANLLNAAIALEHEGIGAYAIALGSGLIPPAAVGLVTSFQGHHKQHRDELAAAIRRLGAVPAESKSIDEYAKDLNAGAITGLVDIQRLALRLERGAANAYLGLIGPIQDSALHLMLARFAADEATHATVFILDLKEMIPTQAPLYGA